jgi:thioredoxin 1
MNLGGDLTQGAVMASASIITVTDANFETVVAQCAQPFLLDLTAVWCGPCKALKPVLEELAREYAGRVAFGSLDVDDNPQTAMKHQVRSVPTLLLFSAGRVLGQLTGAHPKSRIVELLQKVT